MELIKLYEGQTHQFSLKKDVFLKGPVVFMSTNGLSKILLQIE